MIVLQAIGILISLFFLPVCMGLITAKKEDDIKFIWVSGFFYEWVAVFVPTVICVVKYKSLSTATFLSGAFILLLSIAGILVFFVKRTKNDAPLFLIKTDAFNRQEMIYLALFLGIVLFQLYKTVFYAYEDGDDAYYIAEAQSALSSNMMYRINPYLGVVAVSNFRYALAPFPMWIAMLCKCTSINVATMSHVILPPVLIVLTYCIYSEISKLLFDGKREKRYMFLSLVALFMMFENVSTSTQGTFLLTRSRQGKEALANIVLPFLFLLIFKLIKENLTLNFNNWLMITVTCFSAALTSLFGNILAPLMILALFVYAVYKKAEFKTLLCIAVTVVPNMAVAFCYVIR